MISHRERCHAYLLVFRLLLLLVFQILFEALAAQRRLLGGRSQRVDGAMLLLQHSKELFVLRDEFLWRYQRKVALEAVRLRDEPARALTKQRAIVPTSTLSL